MPTELRIRSKHFRAETYNLSTTLDCGQAFRWLEQDGSWAGVIHGQWLLATDEGDRIRIDTTDQSSNWDQVANYFRFEENIDAITTHFPNDEHMLKAVTAYRGLRLLRQDPWECLASFILSSTKQIRHIRQIISNIARTYGEELPTPSGHDTAFTFPSPTTVARLSETDLRKLGMGYRAPFLRQAAQAISNGAFSLLDIDLAPYGEAKATLQQLAGVGPKIADCVLLFAYGKQQAFPIDVWVKRALNELYFSEQTPSPRTVESFAQTYFKPNPGYAQQYLFHYMRMMHASTTQTKTRSSKS